MHKKRLIYGLILGLLCAGLVARIGLWFWHTVRADEEAKKITEYRAQHKFDWMNQYLALAPPSPRISNQHPCVYESMSQHTGPQLGQCKTGWSLFSDPVDQFEVDLRYGTFVLRQTDLFLKDSFPVPFTRAYTSFDWIDPNPVHAFGRNSNHTYDISPLGGSPHSLFSSMSIALEDGDFLSFDRISPGENYSDGLYRHSETSGPFYKAIIYWNGTGWTTKLADGSLILFPDSYGAKKISDGAATEIDDAKGNKLRLERDAERNLRLIRTPHEQYIRLIYDDGRIARVEDDGDHWVAYSYNRDGMLTSVVYSSGKKRRYEYDGTNLTVIRDENDNILVSNSYNQHQVISQQFPDGRTYEYTYNLSPNWHYAESVDIRLPDGTQQTVETGSSVPDYLRKMKLEQAKQ